jgi:hypothetical protein
MSKYVRKKPTKNAQFIFLLLLFLLILSIREFVRRAETFIGRRKQLMPPYDFSKVAG